MDKLTNPSFTSNYTEVFYRNGSSDTNKEVPTHFIVSGLDNRMFAQLDFQDGPIKEGDGVNGVFNEDLLLMVISRLEAFQKGPMPDLNTEKALDKLYEAVFWLRKRTNERASRGVLGTHNN